MRFLGILLCLSVFLFEIPAVEAKEINNEKRHQPDVICPNEMNYGDLEKSFEELCRQIKEAGLHDKWDNYLMKSSHFNHQEYWQVTSKLGGEFTRDMGKLNGCAKKVTEEEKQYSSEWLKDFIAQFGEEYAARNIDKIKFVITSFWIANGAGKCDAIEKEAIYKEIIYREALRQYAGAFIKFSETLDKDNQEKTKGLVSLSKAIMENPDNLIGRTIARPRVHQHLYSIALQSRKDLDPGLIEFFSKQPLFSKPFDAMRAIRDLRRFEKTE